jgi:hypothetical protein
MAGQHPLYIPPKSRWDVRLTSNYLTHMEIQHYIIVEEQERELYERATAGNKCVQLLTLDKKYQAEYQTLDDIVDTKSKGPGPARNFAWDHSIANGFTWHWVMDDNIRGFYRLHNNMRIRVKTNTFFCIMEDFCARYTNILMAGPSYVFFAPSRQKRPPYILNTRIYSCNLIRNDCRYRWRGRYNEDTILSLDMLKDGWCTVQFNALLQMKAGTQTIKGGNTKEFYAKEGTAPKSRLLKAVYPQYTRLMWLFKREHHFIDYKKYFKKNKLILKKDIKIEPGINNYGMELKDIKNGMDK